MFVVKFECNSDALCCCYIALRVSLIRPRLARTIFIDQKHQFQPHGQRRRLLAFEEEPTRQLCNTMYALRSFSCLTIFSCPPRFMNSLFDKCGTNTLNSAVHRPTEYTLTHSNKLPPRSWVVCQHQQHPPPSLWDFLVKILPILVTDADEWTTERSHKERWSHNFRNPHSLYPTTKTHGMECPRRVCITAVNTFVCLPLQGGHIQQEFLIVRTEALTAA